MRFPLVPVLILLVIWLLVDVYLYIVARKRCEGKMWMRIHLASAGAFYACFVVAVAMLFGGGNSGFTTAMWLLLGLMSVYLPKLLFTSVDIIASVIKMLKLPRVRIGSYRWPRVRSLSYLGGGLAILLFGAIWWGALINRFNLDVNEVEVRVNNLPESFDGYRIVQLSDLHLGTYGHDTTFVDKIVRKVTELDADMIVFTGDIVTRRTDELAPHWRTLSRLRARDGVYAILGNHDYGDYDVWPDAEAKAENMTELYRYFSLMDWHLLLNDYKYIRHGNDSIALIGVENVGDPPFTVYGSLRDSYPTLDDDNVKILLSHNPAHWDMEIADNDSLKIDLTLSGHTHAMQIKVMGWSPAAWRYEHWGGLYLDSRGKSPLYVNIGVGTTGFPMRIGATPEITVITLKSN